MPKRNILRAAAVCAALFMLTSCGENPPEFSYAVTTAASPDTAAEQPDITSTVPDSAQPDTVSANLTSFVSAYDPAHYISVSFNKNNVSISGVYDGDTLSDIELGGLSYSHYIKYDGAAFSAEFPAGADYTGYFMLDFCFRNSLAMEFPVYYDSSGFSLITGGNEKKNAEVYASPLEMPTEAVRQYLVADGTDDDARAVLEQIKTISDTVCEGIADDYDKARALAYWVSKNIYYDFDASHTEVDVETIALSRVLELHRTTCGGFSSLYAALCAAQGIKVYNIIGQSISDGISFAETVNAAAGHEWTVLELSGRLVTVDTTWNTANAFADGDYRGRRTTYQYFDAADEVFALDHKALRCEYRDYFGYFGEA